MFILFVKPRPSLIVLRATAQPFKDNPMSNGRILCVFLFLCRHLIGQHVVASRHALLVEIFFFFFHRASLKRVVFLTLLQPTKTRTMQRMNWRDSLRVLQMWAWNIALCFFYYYYYCSLYLNKKMKLVTLLRLQIGFSFSKKKSNK